MKNTTPYICDTCGCGVSSHYDGVKVGDGVLCMPCFIATKPRCETCGDRLSERGDIALGYVVNCIACVSRADTARRMSYHQQSDCNDCTAALNEDGTCPVCDATDDSNSEGTDSMHLPTFVYVPTAVVHDGDGEERTHAEGTVYYRLTSAQAHTVTGWLCDDGTDRNATCTPCSDAEVVTHAELMTRIDRYRAHTADGYYVPTWYIVMHAIGDSHDDSTCATGTADEWCTCGRHLNDDGLCDAIACVQERMQQAHDRRSQPNTWCACGYRLNTDGTCDDCLKSEQSSHAVRAQDSTVSVPFRVLNSIVG